MMKEMKAKGVDVEIRGKDVDDMEFDSDSSSVDSDSESIFSETPTTSDQSKIFRGTPDEIEERIKDNLDSITNTQLSYFVEVVKQCEHTCDLSKRLTCPIYKKYEAIDEE